LKNDPSRWARRQPSFKVMEVLKRARELEREGRRVIHFEVGEPDFPTASVIVEAGKRALDDGHTGYTEALGIPELRNAIADDYCSRFGINIELSRIAVTSAGKWCTQSPLLSVIESRRPGVDVRSWLSL